MPKKVKLDPKGFAFIFEDTWFRTTALQLAKPASKPIAAGAVTEEVMTIPEAVLTQAEMASASRLFKQGGIVRKSDMEDVITKVVLYSKLPNLISKHTKQHPTLPSWQAVNRKEGQGVGKFIKGELKRANKTGGAIFKLVAKDEKKQDKRIATLEKAQLLRQECSDLLRDVVKFRKETGVFDEKYMVESRLGLHETKPMENLAIVLEVSSKMECCDEARDDCVKFLQTVVGSFDEESDMYDKVSSFNIFLISDVEGEQIKSWMPTYMKQDTPKKGLAEAIKWITKQYTAKKMVGDWPPDYESAMERLLYNQDRLGGPLAPPGVEFQAPGSIYMWISHAPEFGSASEGARLLQQFRLEKNKNDVCKVTALLHEPSCAKKMREDGTDGNEKNAIWGPDYFDADYVVDTTKGDCAHVMNLLADAKKKEKALAKEEKKLLKMEDLSDTINEKISFLRQQCQITNMLENDLLSLDLGINTADNPNDTRMPHPEILEQEETMAGD